MKVGQKVVCIKAAGSLIDKEIYTISSIEKKDYGTAVQVVEVKNGSGYIGFHIWRFREIDTNWVDSLLEGISEDERIITLN